MNNHLISTQQWFEQFVLKYNLCPFAHKPHKNKQIHYVLSSATSAEELLKDLLNELNELYELLLETRETTLLVHPFMLQDFTEYNEFLDIAEQLLKVEGFLGHIQLASFHPDYQFADTEEDDAENYTNRSPYPMLHLIREDTLEKAIETYPDVDQIPIRNIEIMEQLGSEHLSSLLQQYQQAEKDRL